MKVIQKKYLLIFWFALIDVFIIDFISKRWAVMESFEPIHFIENVFYLTNYHKNDGIAFGIELPWWLQIMGSLIIIYILINMVVENLYSKNDAPFRMLVLGIIIGGALGNFVDRIVYGFVIDFIALRPFPLFNVADVGITVGLTLLFVTMFMDQRNSKT